jgi:hypothetical protein
MRLFDSPINGVPLPLLNLGRQQNFQIPHMGFLLSHGLFRQSAVL